MEERQFKGIWIPKEIWLTNDLSLQEKVVLVEIDSLEDEEKGCYASNSYFAKFFNLTPSRVSQIINLLVEKQYLTVDYVKDGKQIKERIIKIKRPPYPEVFNKLNRGIKYSKGGYLENCEDNNILSNNIIKNNISNDILKEIVDYLNEKTEKNYKYTSRETKKFIGARLNEGFTINDFKKVIDNKSRDWLNNEMDKYLRPSTLFGTKFEQYLNEKHIKKKEIKQETEEEWVARMEREIEENEHKRS